MDLTSAWCKIEASVESLAPLIFQVSTASPADYPDKAEKIRKVSREIASLCELAKEFSKSASSRLQDPEKGAGVVSGEVDLTQDDT